MQREVEKIILNIISTEMDLPSNNGVDKEGNVIPVTVIGDDNAELYNTDNIQLYASNLSSQLMSSQSKLDLDLDPPEETITTRVLESIQIDIMSRNSDARKRRYEVVAALNSIYSKQMQEEYQFKIAKLPNSFVNSSIAEAPAQINRYSLTVDCFTWYTVTKIKDEFFDQFTTRVDNEDTIGQPEGLIEFTEG